MLPNQIIEPSGSLSDYVMFISGEKKCGKTAFCAQFPNHLIFEFECGNASHIKCNYVDIPNLNVFLGLLKEAQAGLNGIKTIILDEVNILYKMLVNKLCKDANVLDPMDLGWGKGYKRINDDFDRYLNILQSLDCGIIYTSHSELREISLRSGRKIERLCPRTGKHVRDFCYDINSQLCGVMMFDENRNRIMQVVGDDYIEAGHGFTSMDRFLTVQNGFIPLGSSPSQAYQNFQKAWNNETLDYGNKTKPKKKMMLKK